MTTMPACYLTTVDGDGFPHTTAMVNLCCAKDFPALVELHEEGKDAFTLYLSTGMQSNKMARMQANPKVCVYFCDPGQFVGLMLGGEIEIITDKDLKNRIWHEDWTMYYPSGPEGPDYGVIKLAPKAAKGWNQSEPYELKIGEAS